MIMEFYGVRFPKGAKLSDRESNDQQEERGRVIQNKDEALKLVKSVKGSRFKCFQSRQEAEEFVNAEEIEVRNHLCQKLT